MNRINIDLRLNELEAVNERLRVVIKNTRPNMERALKLKIQRKTRCSNAIY